MAWDKLTRLKEEGGLGFRDFKAFNMAMVAKQGWFLMNNPQALVTRIFKARYFPRTSFFDAKLGYNPSFVWRSIWKAREVLTIGCRWRIGDGRNITVMNNPWLRGSKDGYVSGPQTQGVYTITVNELILPNIKQWNFRVLRDFFDPSVIQEILKVPLFEDVMEDRLVWSEDVNGNYSVRSGYRLWMKHLHNHVPLREGSQWKTLWKMSAPSRVKHLIWRICSDCLPTKVRLIQHHVQCSPVCQFCGDCYEDDWHVFFGCTVTNACWKEAGLLDIISPRTQKFHDTQSLIFDLCAKEDRKVVGRVAVMMDGLWKNRNDFIWHNEKEEATKLGWFAIHKWQEWYLAQNQEVSLGEIPNIVNWSPPPNGWFKCNVDAGFNHQVGTTNRGWCIRNDQGFFVNAGTAWDGGILSVLEAEALALKEAIMVAKPLHPTPMIFESDAQQVVHALSSNLSGNSEFILIINSVKSLLLEVPNFEVKFVKRQANMVAHTLAKTANSWPRRCLFDVIPPCINLHLNNERS